MPTTLPRRQVRAKNQRLEAALALAILGEGIMLFALTPHGSRARAAAVPAVSAEQAVARITDAMLAP